jgi:hypothetical protein
MEPAYVKRRATGNDRMVLSVLENTTWSEKFALIPPPVTVLFSD